MYNALSIAGSDSSGGAGIQADIKTFSANGVYGMSVITSVTAQNTQGVIYIQHLDPITVEKQLEAIFSDIEVNSIKIGMIGKAQTAHIISQSLNRYKLPPIILDPVMVSTSGKELIEEEAKGMLLKDLFPIATIITPNIPEAEDILKVKINNLEDMKNACKELKIYGSAYVLLKGGHLKNSSCDILYDGNDFAIYDSERIHTKNTHGTGCTLSSAIAANISKGYNVKNAVFYAKKYITSAIKNGFNLGKGNGPINHFYFLNKDDKFNL